MKKTVGILIAVVIAGPAAWYYWGDSLAGGRPKFRTLPVMRGDLFVGVTATGTVEAVETIDVGAQIIASVKSFGPDPDHPGKMIDYCSRVKKGAVLAQLDDLPLKAELEKARVHLRLAEADLDHCRARRKLTERAFRRAKELRETDSAAEYEKAEAEDAMAAAEVAMAEAKVDQAKIAAKQAEINLSYTTITSPIDGIVIARRVNVGQTVVAGMNAPSLFLLAKDLSHMRVWAAVNEADIGEIKVGQTVTFSVDTYRDRTFSGKVSQIRLDASLQHDVVTYGVMVDVDNADGKLLPYMTPKLQFEVARRRNAILVPNQALRWQPTWRQISPSAQVGLTPPERGKTSAGELHESGEDNEPRVDLGSPTVWAVARDGLVRPVPVEVGLSDGMATEILSGNIAADDLIVAGVERSGEPDFVSSFVSKLTENKQ
jgi:HlyD family secretion protein